MVKREMQILPWQNDVSHSPKTKSGSACWTYVICFRLNELNERVTYSENVKPCYRFHVVDDTRWGTLEET